MGNTTLWVMGPGGSFKAIGKPPYNPAAPAPTYGPVRFATLADAKLALGAPTDANYVTWTFGTAYLNTVFDSLGVNDILVLPERVKSDGTPDPYLLDSSQGFKAANVTAVSATGGGTTPIVSSPRLWFSMGRARRGIIGLGPNVVIAPSVSSFTAPAQPYPQTVYYAGGSTGTLTGSQNVLLEMEHAQPFVANFKMTGRDFGGVSYGALVTRAPNNAANLSTWKNLDLYQAHRGFSGVPNGETGGIGLLGGQYVIDNVNVDNTLAPSPIMWNRNTGGTMSHVKTAKPAYGMLTWWQCNGTNTLDDVIVDGHGQCMNLEEGGSSFVMNWSNSTLKSDGNWHVIGESSGGSKKVHLVNCVVTGGITPGSLCVSIYTYTSTAVQKRSDFTRDNGPIFFSGSTIP